MIRVLLILMILVLPSIAKAELKIFACEPEWASLSQEIGGDKVNVFSAINGRRDAHYVRAKPSLISKASKSDLIFCSGAGLESAWLSLLLQRASYNVQPGKIGNLMATDYVKLLEVPVNIDRSLGDIHPEGNPHIHLNPHNILPVAKELLQRLKQLDSKNSIYYDERYDDFIKRWQKSIAIWEKEISFFKEKKIIPHHKSFSYLIEWLKMRQIGVLESKPGISPTVKHLENLLTKVNNQKFIIIRAPYEPAFASEWVAKKTLAKSIILPYTVSGDKTEPQNLFKLFEQILINLKTAYGN